MAKISGANVIGANPIYDTSESVNQFLSTIDAEAKKRQAILANEQKYLQDEINKVKPDGIRERDRDEYTEKYENWKNLAHQINSERDVQKKARLKSDFDKSYLDLQALVDDSKKLSKGEDEVIKMLMDPTKRDSFSDDAIEKFRMSRDLSRNDPNYVRDLTQLERRIDLSKIEEQLRKEEDGLLKNSKWNNPNLVPETRGNKKGVLVTQNRVVDPQVQIDFYLRKSKADPNFKKYLEMQFPGVPVEEQVVRLAESRKLEEFDKPKFEADAKEDNWREKMLMQNALILGRQNQKASNKDEEKLYREQWIDDMIGGVPGSGERLKAMLGAVPGYEPSAINNMIKVNGNIIDFNVPKRDVVTEDALGVEKIKTIPAYTVRIDRNNPADKSKLNALLNNLTGEKINESKYQTGNASGKITSKNNSKSNTGMVTFIMPDGQTGQIPADKAEAFSKKYPKAKRQ